jgi:hypothetical protein
LNGTGATNLVSAIDNEFLPEFIGKDCEFKFPARTAISSSQNIDYYRPTYALADFNLSFTYEKYPTPSNTEISANLKWANYTGEADNHEMIRIEKYFENLMLLVRNKILLNNGNLAKTEFVWFYPASMETYRRNRLERKWQEIYNKYIIEPGEPENSKQILKLSESIAPFYYFNKNLGVTAAVRPVVSMDTGGETTDIVVYANDTPRIQTSVRFAANSIFGDGFNGSPHINGFINTFKDEIFRKLEANRLIDLQFVFEQLIEKETSADIIAFFFSIENNRKVKEKEISLSFNRMLAEDNNLKIIFILFYSSLIYHIAKIMNLKGLESPRYITFSGTGSKVISIADGNQRLATLSDLTSIIFRKVMGQDYGTIELLPSYDVPKEITCKGGLTVPLRQNIGGKTIDITTTEGKKEYERYIDSTKVTLLGDADDTVITMRYDILMDPAEREKLESGIIAEYGKFIELFFSINEEYSFAREFGASLASLQKAKEILQNNDDVRMYLRAGINKKLNCPGDNTESEIEEPFFFYPLVGGINKLAYEISEMQNR